MYVEFVVVMVTWYL